MFVGGSSRTSEHRSLKLPTISQYPSSQVFFLPLIFGLAVIDREAEAYFVCVFYRATTSLSRIHPLSSSVQAESRPPAQSFSQKTYLSRGELVEDALKRIKAAFVLPHPRKELLISMGRDSQKLSGSSLLAHLWHVTNPNLQ